jgi:hypothetical protein
VLKTATGNQSEITAALTVAADLEKRSSSGSADHTVFIGDNDHYRDNVTFSDITTLTRSRDRDNSRTTFRCLELNHR